MTIYLNILTLLLGASGILSLYTVTTSEHKGFYWVAAFNVVLMFTIHVSNIYLDSACVGVMFSCSLLNFLISLKH